MMGRDGVDLRTDQARTGHSTPTLTAPHSLRRMSDLAGAVDDLPTLVPLGPSVAENPLANTGTEGVEGVVPAVVTGCARGIKRHQAALSTSSANRPIHRHNPLRRKGPAP